MGAMSPVSSNIDSLYAAGSCSFVRRRMNGMLNGVCGNMLGGVTEIYASLIVIGLLLLVFNFIIHQFVLTRFRFYDVACWRHTRTAGCGSDVGESGSSGAPTWGDRRFSKHEDGGEASAPAPYRTGSLTMNPVSDAGIVNAHVVASGVQVRTTVHEWMFVMLVFSFHICSHIVHKHTHICSCTSSYKHKHPLA